MKISPINNPISYKGVLNNKFLLKGLEKISSHPASFIAATTLFMSSVVRPKVISKAPNIDEDKKKSLQADAISSGLVKFAITEAIALPVENAIKQIDKNPKNYLNKKTIENLKGSSKSLLESKDYKFASQFLKLSSALLSAVPKSIIAVALIPIVEDLINKKDKNEKKNISFKGGYNKIVSNIFNSENFQKFTKKYSQNEENIARNMNIFTDLLLVSTSVIKTKTSKKIEENKKNTLIYNKAISTALSIFAGYNLDEFIKSKTAGLIEKFKQANMGNPNLSKYIQGINILRPTLIFAAVYYMVLPFVSAICADKLDKGINKNKSA